MKAEITTDGKKILAHIDYANGKGPRMARQVPGARADWDKTVEPNVFLGWKYPLNMDTCRAFRRVFGDELVVLPALSIWARDQIAKEQQLEALREEALTDVDLLRVKAEAPALYAALHNRKYQIAGTAFMLTGRQVILGDDPGLGKTLQTLAALVESDSKTILVACRRTATRTVWERETARWAPGIATFVAQGSRREREEVMAAFADHSTLIPGTRKMLIINIEMVRAKKQEICLSKETVCPQVHGEPCRHKYEPIPDWPFLFGQEWDAIVLDESHNLLASTANYQSKRITQQRFGAVILRRKLREDGLAIALSGTPFRSHIEKGWGTLNWLRPDVFGGYWGWAEKHFGVEQGRFGKIVGGTDENGKARKVLEPHDMDAWDRMLRPYYLKRTKDKVAADLPPIAYAGTPIDPDDPESPCYVQLDMTDEQAKMYWAMEDMGAATLADGVRITATGVLAEISRLRQFANASGRMGDDRHIIPELPSNKIEWLIEFMQERQGTGAKVVVASSFSEMVELAAATLRKEGFEVLTLTGATSDRDRADLVARFQDMNDTLQVVCINRQAGGESITLDAADEMVVLDLPWVDDQDEQLNARIHRVSRIHQVIIYRLVSVGAIDEWMASLTTEQRAAVAKASPRALSELALEATAS
jgi:SNF2 family DNA or RNA helicase